MSDRPYVDFAEVRANITVPDVLEALGLLDQFTRKGETLTGVCPIPTHEHGPKPNPSQFKCNVKDGRWLWHCFGDCDRGGGVIELVKEIKQLSDAHVRLWFAEHFADRISTKRDSQPTREAAVQTEAEPAASTPPPPKRSKLKPLSFQLNLDADCTYLRERGLRPETIKRYGLGLCSKGMMAGYIAIPIYVPGQAAGDNPVGYVGRFAGEKDAWSDEQPRYRFPPDFPRNEVVYGLPLAVRDSPGKPLVVVEGAFKVFHLWQEVHMPNCVATLGASLSDEQAQILIETGRPIVLMLDGNAAAAARAAAGKLIKDAFVRVIALKPDQEPDDLDGDQLRQLLHFAH